MPEERSPRLRPKSNPRLFPARGRPFLLQPAQSGTRNAESGARSSEPGILRAEPWTRRSGPGTRCAESWTRKPGVRNSTHRAWNSTRRARDPARRVGNPVIGKKRSTLRVRGSKRLWASVCPSRPVPESGPGSDPAPGLSWQPQAGQEDSTATPSSSRGCHGRLVRIYRPIQYRWAARCAVCSTRTASARAPCSSSRGEDIGVCMPP
jgi:hypothetical protein